MVLVVYRLERRRLAKGHFDGHCRIETKSWSVGWKHQGGNYLKGNKKSTTINENDADSADRGQEAPAIQVEESSKDGIFRTSSSGRLETIKLRQILNSSIFR